MFRYMVLHFLLLWFVTVALGHYLPNYNFSAVSRQDENGEPIAEIFLDYNKDQPAEVYASHKMDGNRIYEHFIIARKLDNTRRPAGCRKDIPPGYNTLSPGSNYYKVYTISLSWYNAKAICEEDGAHLLILDSEEEADKVTKWVKISNYQRNWFWIGFHELTQARNYVTLDNKSLTSIYNKWSSNYPPNNEANTNCGMWMDSGAERGLADWYCDRGYNFICEIEATH